MKQKSNKLAKLEKNRFSIFTTDFDRCYYCRITSGRQQLDIHEVYGGSNRIRSMKEGLCVPLCRRCHSSEEIIQDLRKWCQKEYEKTHTRNEFIKLIGKSYI